MIVFVPFLTRAIFMDLREGISGTRNACLAFTRKFLSKPRYPEWLDYRGELEIRTMLELKSIVKDNNFARFSFYRAGHMYYTVAVEDVVYSFPIPIEDVGNA